MTGKLLVCMLLLAAPLSAAGSRNDLEAFATRYAAAWSGQEPTALAQFYAENGSLRVNDGEPAVGRAAVEQKAREFMAAFPDMVVRLVELRETGDAVEFHWRWTGTNSGPGGTGNAVDLRGYEQWIFDDDGLILESLGHYDEAEYVRQLAAGTVQVRRLEEGAASPPATLADIAWLAGRWVGEGLGGSAEDVIAPASGGQMMGMFRHSRADGSPNFYEFYLFAEKDRSLTLRLRHFSPMLSAWEERDEFVEFPLVAIAEGAAYFDGLSYVRAEDGRLTVGVRLDEERVAFFHYRRAD
jgi:ketosteroid isomerase-like protein